MGQLNQLKEELAVLEDELDEACGVPDAGRQPEITRARAVVDEARAALESAFLSRRALILAREAVSAAHGAVGAAVQVSRVLRDRSAVLRSRATGLRAELEDSAPAGTRSRPWPSPGSAEPGSVVLDSAIPPDHPRKKGIEEAVCRLLSMHGGRWEVCITLPPRGRWWGLRVRGPALDWVGTLQDEEEQTEEAVLARLEPLVRVAAAEVFYRRARRSPPSRTGERDGA